MQYVLVRAADGWYVADPNQNPNGGSYTRVLQYAKRFPTKEAAERERCGNESIQEL